MILKLLTGGIDLPELLERIRAPHSEFVAARCDNIRPVPYDSLSKRLNLMDDRIAGKATTGDLTLLQSGVHDLIASRALAEEVETLKQRLERLAYHVLPGLIEEGDYNVALGSETVGRRVSELEATVAALSAKVEALMAAKLGEVKARKASAKK